MLDLCLRHLHRPAEPGAGEPGLLVLMHGVGSNAEDLFGLAQYVPAHLHVVSLEAPYPMSPHMPAYAWFMFGVQPDGSRVIDEKQELQSRALVAHTVEHAAQQLGLSMERVVVGGFSQGGIMALSLLLTQPELLHGVCVWHSRLLPEVLPRQVANAKLEGRVAWVSHGSQDSVIAPAQAHRIRDHLQATPLALTYSEYPCDHNIHPQELQASMQWLAQQLPAGR